MTSFSEWLKQRSPAVYDTVSGFGNRTGPAGAALQGAYQGITDPFRLSAQVFNTLGNTVGLRSDEDAVRASQGINQAFKSIPFTNDAQEQIFRDSANQYKGTSEFNNIVPGLLAGQTLLKAGVTKTGTIIPVANSARVMQSGHSIKNQGYAEALDTFTNRK